MQAQLLVGLGAFGIVDASHDPRHFEDVLGNLGRHDVAVVAFSDRHEAVGVFDTRPSEHVGIGAVTDDLVAFEVVGEDSPGSRARELVGVSVDDHHVVAGLVHVGCQLRAHPTAADYEELQGWLIIGRHSWQLRPLLLGFGRLRFPFTFMGLMALGIGIWVLAYLAGHRGLDPESQAIAAATVLISWSLGAYVVVRRLRRGPQH